jgi:2-phospho-L-lactate guanylyltransferase
MGTLAILPIKNFDDAKGRLGDGFDAGPRRALAEAMFSDVVVALRRAGSVGRILVVSADPAAQQIAAGHGAGVLDEPDRGHNAAASAGIRVALEAGEERVLLVPGDCPLLDPQEVDQLIAHPARGRSALIVPDRHGTGTNALLLTPPGSLEPAFGPGSCERHVTNANATGTAPEVVGVPTLALDVDTPEDLDALSAALTERHGGAAHTRGMLRQLLRSRS